MKTIHFICHHSENASDWPFFKHLREIKPSIQVLVFSNEVALRYQSRWKLLLAGYPKLTLSSLRTVYRSARSVSPADIVVVEEHLQAWPLILVYSLVGFFNRRKPEFIFLGFLFTQRSSSLANRLRHLYFTMALTVFDKVIVYSEGEREFLAEHFRPTAPKLIPIHYGIGDHETTLQHSRNIIEGNPNQSTKRTHPLRIFSAGRSGRDYETMVKALEMLEIPFIATIVCDSRDSCPDSLARPWLRILRNCFELEYTAELIKSDVVIVPLKNTSISSGQMVIMHGLASGKPIIASNTPIASEYFSEITTIDLVPVADPSSLAAAITKIDNDSKNGKSWALRSRQYFEARFSIKRFAERFHDTLQLINRLNQEEVKLPGK